MNGAAGCKQTRLWCRDPAHPWHDSLRLAGCKPGVEIGVWQHVMAQHVMALVNLPMLCDVSSGANPK
jgi:hypothetical protein